MELARAATEDAPLPERELSLLVARSGGNPLFLRELIAAARSGDAVESLPESIEEVAAARIDRLPVDARRLLRRMSVLGRSFPVELLAEVVDDLPGPDDPTWGQLEEFVIRDDTGMLSFRDGLSRDSAYGGLTFQLRRQLHSRAADTSTADRSTATRSNRNSCRSTISTRNASARLGSSRSGQPTVPSLSTPTPKRPSFMNGRSPRRDDSLT